MNSKTNQAKKQLLKSTLIFLLALTGIASMNAQPLSLSLTALDSLIACKKGSFRITLQVQQPATLIIRDSINLSCNGTNSCPAAVLTHFEVDSAATGLSFQFNNNQWELAFSDSGTYTIKYSVAIDCGMIPSCPDSVNTGIKLFQRFFLNQDTLVVNNTGSATVNHRIYYPYLVDLTQQQFYGNYLDTVNVYHIYQNTGLVDASVYFRFYPAAETDCSADSTLEIKWAVGPPAGNFAGLNYNNTAIAAYDSTIIPHGSALIIWKKIVLKECPDVPGNGCNEIKDSLVWRCKLDTLQQVNYCTHCPGSLKNSYALIRTGTPLISFERINPVVDTDFSCMNDTVQWEFRIRNTGSQHVPEALINLFCNSSDVPSQLLLVDSSSVSLIAHNGNTTSIDTVTFFTAALCQSAITHPLLRMRWKVNNFMKGDSLTLRFSTYRCCEENPVLYNLPKSFGFWALQAYSRTACGSLVEHNLNYISGNPQWELKADYFPTVTQLNVPKDSVFGPSTPLMFVDLSSSSGIYAPNYQLFGCNSLPCTSLNGLLHITLYCEPGIVPDTPLVHLVSFPNQPFRKLEPVYWYADSSNTCDTNFTHYYFDLSDSNAVHLINNGRIAFRLRSCCGAYYLSQPNYALRIDFILSPTAGCVNMDFSNTNHTVPPACLSSNCCSLPMASAGNKLDIRCPGCLSPGIELNVYNISRISLGMRDTNNNSLADVPLLPIDSAYLDSYQSVMRTSCAGYGDKLLDRLLGHFQDGDSGNNGYTYQQMLDSGSVLNVLQLERKFNSNNNYPIGLTVDTLMLYIDVPEDSLTNNCIDCLPFISDTAYRTIHIIRVTGAALNDYVEYDSIPNRILFSFDATDSTGNIFQNVVYSDAANPFSAYFPYQRYRLMTVYSVCNWYAPASAVFQSPSEQVREFDVINNMFLCGRRLLLTELDTTRNQPNDLDTLSALGITFNQNFANTYEFRCAGFAGRFYFYADEVQNISFYRSVQGDSCHKFIRINLLSRTAGLAYQGKYPFEYRQPSFAPQRVAALVPPGYTASGTGTISSTMTYFLPQTNQPYTITSQPLAFSLTTIGDSVIIHLDSVFMTLPLRCYSDTSLSMNRLYAADNLISLTIEVPLTANSCQVAQTQPAFGDITARFTRHFPACYNVAALSCPDAERLPLRPVATDTLLMPRPEISAQSLTPAAYALSNNVCWNVNILNTHLGQGYFLYLNQPVSPFFSNWTLHFQNDTLLPVNGVFHVLNVIPQDSVYELQLCASYDSCSAANDSLYLIFGWNCNDFPVSATAAYQACFTDSIVLKWENTNINVSSQVLHPDSVSLCTPFTIAGVLKSLDLGSIYPQSVSLDSLAGFTLMDGQLLFSQSPMVINLPVSAAPVWNIASLIDSAGWFSNDSSLLNRGKSVTAVFTFQMDCNLQLQPGDTLHLPLITFGYSGYCNDSLFYQQARTQPQQFMDYHAIYTGTSNCTDCFSIAKLPSADTVATGDTMHFYIVICGNNSQGDTLSLDENLPPNFVLTGSLPATVILPAQGCDTITVTGYFTAPGECIDNINTATIVTSSSDSLSADACVTVAEPCLLNADIIIPDSAFSSTYGQNISNKSIYIMGRFYINNNLTLQNCEVSVAPGGQIIVLQDLLELDNSVIEGCGFMWKSIHLVTQSANLAVRGSRISDADTAIVAEDLTRVEVYDSDITECVRGIYTVPVTTGNYSLSTVVVYGTRFGMWNSGTFKPGYPGQPPHGNKPFTGIHLNNMAGVTVGDYNQNMNEFRDMNTGIVSVASVVKILNSQFRNIQPEQFYNEPYNGTAVVSVSDPLQTKSDILFKPAGAGSITVDSCLRGMYSVYSTGLVTDITMDNTQTGVFVSKTTLSGKFTVMNCEITAGDYGIYWQDNHGAKEMKAESNFIYVTKKKGVGIYLSELITGNSVKYDITGNYITLYGARYGIHSLNVNRPQITYNTVDQQMGAGGNAPLTEGIVTEGSPGAILSCNSVMLNYGIMVSNTAGIRISQCPDALIQCNTTNRHYYGIYFGGITPVVFRGNTMYDHYAGLYLNNVAVIDTQTHAGNRWLGTYSSNYGAVNMNDSSQFNLSLSLLIIDPQLGSDYSPAIPVNKLDPPFFVNDQGWIYLFPGAPFTCTGQYSCNAFLINEGSKDLKLRIANDETLTKEYIQESKTIAKEFLYDVLKKDSILLNSDAAFLIFMQQQTNSNIAKLHSANEAIGFATTIVKEIEDSLDLLNSQLTAYTDSIFITDSLLYTTLQATYLQRKEYLIKVLDSLNVKWDSLIYQWKVDSYIHWDDALEYNSLVNGSEDPVLNQKLVNFSLIRYFQHSIDSLMNDYGQLLSIAQQCPYKGGRAVYQARALLKFFNDTIEYEDDAVCLQQGIFRNSTITTKLKENEIFIKPNPAINLIEVTLNSTNSGICNIVISNMLNEKLLEIKINCSENKTQLDIRKLSPGIYKVMIEIDGIPMLTKKLIIIR